MGLCGALLHVKDPRLQHRMHKRGLQGRLHLLLLHIHIGSDHCNHHSHPAGHIVRAKANLKSQRLNQIYRVEVDEGENLIDVSTGENPGDKQLLMNFYENMDGMSNEEITEFIEETLSGDRLEAVEYLPGDSNLLSSVCLRRYTRSDSEDNGGQNLARDCIVCNMNFDEGSEILYHPVCDHRYHWMCLESWLKVRRACAYCFKPTRKNLIEAFRDRREVNV